MVQKLLSDGHSVRALVRSADKAASVLPKDDRLECQVVDFGTADAAALKTACADTDRCIWCATGFSDAASRLNKLKGLFGVAVTPKRSIDIVGLGALAQAFKSSPGADSGSSSSSSPQIVRLSSAGVTRPGWDEAKAEQLAGAADIPIVRLNPFGILDQKLNAEDNLRSSGARYVGWNLPRVWPSPPSPNGFA